MADTLRAALTAALSALEYHQGQTRPIHRTQEAIAQARAALAAQEKADPFGYFRATPTGWEDCAEDAEGAVALYERPPAPQPVAVPAERWDGDDKIESPFNACQHRGYCVTLKAAAPAAPAQAQPLTDRQLEDLIPTTGNVEAA